MLATEQRQRANQSGQEEWEALPVNALMNKKISNEAWGSKIRFFEEGLHYGNLYIQDRGLGNNLKELVEVHHRNPVQFILSWHDEGSIEGDTAEAGDGWMLYRKADKT
jgi:hypothetical protein